MTIYTPGTLETDPKKQNMALQQHASSISTAQTNIASNTTNIASNTANIATNTSNIATNTTNIASNTSAITTLQTPNYGLVNSGGALGVSLSKVTNTLSGDVTLNTNAFFDGPSCAQGTTGTWLAVGQVTILDATAAASFSIKLWDGTTVIASTNATTPAVNIPACITLSGLLASPAGNIKISVSDGNGTPNGRIKFNLSGASKDSTLTVWRII